MTMNFPSSPSNGDVFTNSATGIKYTYSTAKGVWETLQFPTNASHVPLSGGTMTGNLSLGTNDLTVGDVTASGAINVAGDVNIGAYNGGSTTADGVLFGAGGGVYSQLQASAAGTGVLWQGMHGSTYTSRINAAGASEFSGVLKVDRTVSGDGCFHAALNGTVKASIASDGSATFNGPVKIGGSAAANEMEEYEEGTWTPVIKSGTNTITYSGNHGHFTYTKIGRLVKVYFTMSGMTTAGTTGGDCSVTGLPFTSTSANNFRYISGDAMFYNSGMTLDAFPIWVHMGHSETQVNFYEKASAGAGYGSVHVNTVGANTFWFWTLAYYTD